MGWGADVDVRLANDPDELDPVPLEQLRLLERMGACVSVGASGVLPAELFIDAILGYGLRGDPRTGAAELIVATLGARVLSLDVPSRVELEGGTVGEPAVHAEATVTLALPKATLRLDVARPRVGDLYLADISIPPAVYERLDIPYPRIKRRSPADQSSAFADVGFGLNPLPRQAVKCCDAGPMAGAGSTLKARRAAKACAARRVAGRSVGLVARGGRPLQRTAFSAQCTGRDCSLRSRSSRSTSGGRCCCSPA